MAGHVVLSRQALDTPPVFPITSYTRLALASVVATSPTITLSASTHTHTHTQKLKHHLPGKPQSPICGKIGNKRCLVIGHFIECEIDRDYRSVSSHRWMETRLAANAIADTITIAKTNKRKSIPEASPEQPGNNTASLSLANNKKTKTTTEVPSPLQTP